MLSKQHLFWIAWPAFLVAGVLEIMVFAVLDPDTLALFGTHFGWTRPAVYTVTFFIFWFMIMVSGALTVLLSLPAAEINRPHADA